MPSRTICSWVSCNSINHKHSQKFLHSLGDWFIDRRSWEVSVSTRTATIFCLVCSHVSAGGAVASSICFGCFSLSCLLWSASERASTLVTAPSHTRLLRLGSQVCRLSEKSKKTWKREWWWLLRDDKSSVNFVDLYQCWASLIPAAEGESVANGVICSQRKRKTGSDNYPPPYFSRMEKSKQLLRFGKK